MRNFSLLFKESFIEVLFILCLGLIYFGNNNDNVSFDLPFKIHDIKKYFV